METPRPKFSVIIPSYNHASYLGAALDSILAQTFTDWEIVIANDGSTDRTREVMDEYQARDRRIRGFHKENGGVVSALNHALRQTRGHWICWLSSDDLYEPHALATHHRAIVDNPGISFFHSNYSILDEALGVKTNQSSGWQTTAPPRHRQVIQWFLNNYVHGNSFAASRSVFESVGLFADAYRYAQDFDMWLRISARFPLKYISAHTCVTRTHSGQTTHSFPQACFLDSARACVEFLNRTDFCSLFPGVDLNTNAGANQALQDSLQIALNPSAVMYCGGVMCPAFLSRIREWLTRWAPSVFRTAAAQTLRQIVREVVALPFPDEFKTAVQHLAHLDQPYSYEQHDFLAAVNERAIRIAATDPETSQWLLRYLKHSQQFPVTHPPTSRHECLKTADLWVM